MARARNLKPAFFKNEYLGELPPLARLLYQGLWTLADCEGRLECRIKQIKAEILPYDECDVAQLLAMLSEHPEKFIILYTVNHVAYIWIPKFKMHQHPHPNEKAIGSKIPEYKANLIQSRLITINHDDSLSTHGAIGPLPSSLFPLKESLTPPASVGTGVPVEVCESEPKPKPERASKAKTTLSEPQEILFKRFWQAYPRKVKIAKARKAWAGIKPLPTEQFTDDCLKAIDRQCRCDQWRKDGGQFIQHPATWLNSEQWEDQPIKLPPISQVLGKEFHKNPTIEDYT